MTQSSIRHGNSEAVLHRGQRHVMFDPFPDEQDFPAAEWPNVVDTLEQNFSCSRMVRVLSALCAYFKCEVAELLEYKADKKRK